MHAFATIFIFINFIMKGGITVKKYEAPMAVRVEFPKALAAECMLN
jgi:hypothetical protein